MIPAELALAPDAPLVEVEVEVLPVLVPVEVPPVVLVPVPPVVLVPVPPVVVPLVLVVPLVVVLVTADPDKTVVLAVDEKRELVYEGEAVRIGNKEELAETTSARAAR